MNPIGSAIRGAAVVVWPIVLLTILAIVLGGWGSTLAVIGCVTVGVLTAAIVAYLQVLKRSDTVYRRSIADGLTRAFEGSRVIEENVDVRQLRLIVLSDQHKGTRDGADDFWRSERAYAAALAHYYEQGQRLVVLGDAEELWECWSKSSLMRRYREVLELEAQFQAEGRYERVWGNHDADWRRARSVDRHLAPIFGSGLAVHEAIKLHLTDDGKRLGTLFLVHGHQGTADSEIFAHVSRPFVLLFGLAQRKFKKPWNTPAANWDLRERHDRAMFHWARNRSQEGVVLIAGHTHRPVFWDRRPHVPTSEHIRNLAQRLEQLRREGATVSQLSETRAELEYRRAEQRWTTKPPAVIEPPCYFNTGCCAFADGDATGIEIAAGKIRLVRFPDDDYRPRPQVLGESAELTDVLERVRSFGGIGSSVEP